MAVQINERFKMSFPNKTEFKWTGFKCVIEEGWRWLKNIFFNLQYLPNCDLVLFLRDGSIVEQGSHDELRESGGEYYDYYLATKSHDGQSESKY